MLIVAEVISVDGKVPPLGFVEDARDRGSNVRIIDGKLNKSVRQNGPRGFYSAIFVDPNINEHYILKDSTKDDIHYDLLTQEAMRDLIDMTTLNGVVCYHTSHRTLEFYKPLSAAAANLGLASKRVMDWGHLRGRNVAFDDSHFASEWLVVARSKEHLVKFQTEKSKTRNIEWDVPPADEWPAWRDGVEPKMPNRR